MAKTNYFGPIQSVKEAEDNIKGASWALYGLGALMAVFGYFFLPSVVMDGVIWIVIAFLLSRFRNKLMAIVFIVFSIASFVATVLAKLGVLEGGNNIILAAIILWSSYRVWLSVKYLETHKYKA